MNITHFFFFGAQGKKGSNSIFPKKKPRADFLFPTQLAKKKAQPEKEKKKREPRSLTSLSFFFI